MMTILIATGITVGLTIILAVLLLIAEKYLVNYGTCKININKGSKELEVKGGDSLLASLKAGGVHIASACGGRGTCAYCKCKITAGGGPVVPTEEPLLSAEELKNDIRISCQVKVRNDLEIEIPEELLAVKEYRAVVEKITPLTHDIRELRMKLIEPDRMDYVPGRYVQLECPPYGDNPEPVSRAYSISSIPSDAGYIELIIRLVPGGIVTTWVFEHLQEGDEVKLTGPYGEFEISDTDAPMVWIAGGSGMAPFWSMVRHCTEQGITRQVKYFFGAVTPRDLYYVDQLQAIADEHPWFEFYPALSGENLDDWTGEKGLITEVVGRKVSDPASEGYLCGSPGMCDASVKALNQLGIPEEKVYFDKFG